jgi:hypothetical protein
MCEMTMPAATNRVGVGVAIILQANRREESNIFAFQ